MKQLSTYQTILRNLMKASRALHCVVKWLKPVVLVCPERVCQMNLPEGECHQCDVILVLVENGGCG